MELRGNRSVIIKNNNLKKKQTRRTCDLLFSVNTGMTFFWKKDIKLWNNINNFLEIECFVNKAWGYFISLPSFIKEEKCVFESRS